MNNANTQHPRFKRVKCLLALAAAGNRSAAFEAARLLTNGGRAPIPSKMLNQRQRRKIDRQMQRK